MERRSLDFYEIGTTQLRRSMRPASVVSLDLRFETLFPLSTPSLSLPLDPPEGAKSATEKRRAAIRTLPLFLGSSFSGDFSRRDRGMCSRFRNGPRK